VRPVLVQDDQLLALLGDGAPLHWQTVPKSPSVPSYPTASSAWSWLGLEYHSFNGVASGILNRMHVAQKFEHLLDTYRHADGHNWTGAELDKATGGVVTRSYVTNLRKGRIENPGYEKMRAIAKVMGFAPEV
jgi:hypothetical protein